MKLKTLEIQLQKLNGFENPKADLEQYMTPANIAARMLYSAFLAGDIEGMSVTDLGCGTGILSIGAKLIGADKVFGVDCDMQALNSAKENAENAGLNECDIEWILSRVDENFCKDSDTVVMNPPFGAQNIHADRPFIESALKSAQVIWGVFNHGSLKFLESFTKGRCEITDKVSAKLNIPKQFSFHTKENLEIPVEIIRLEKI
ncbi:MAG TPA: METTL5 family protein [Methanocorpusculum sp.]|nr:METTL5 family protein [Methanocorpusculum sp.]